MGLPAGVLSFLNGAGPVAGDALAGHPGVDAICFIGSAATGRSVAARAAGKTQILELGGNGPLVVLDDADLDLAVDATLEAAYLCAGQNCTAGERILVHRAVRRDYVERLEAAVTERVRSEIPSIRRRPWARSTTRAWRQRPTSTSARRFGPGRGS